MLVNLQPLFTDPILEQNYLYPGYDDHASDVWHVRTTTEDVIVRRSRIANYPANPFQAGAFHLFGTDPRRVADLLHVNTLLAEVSPVPIPHVLRIGAIDTIPYAIVARLNGQQLLRFNAPMAETLGDAMGRIHSRQFQTCGAPAGQVRYPIADFPARLSDTLRTLATHWSGRDPKLAAALEPMCRAATRVRPPEWGALIMPDLDPTQFLHDGNRLTGLVDTEFYCLGPRELDFIALEYVLGAEEAAGFLRGYARHLPLPDLDPVRRVYRYLYRLMDTQGSVDLDQWLDSPTRF